MSAFASLIPPHLVEPVTAALAPPINLFATALLQQRVMREMIDRHFGSSFGDIAYQRNQLASFRKQVVYPWAVRPRTLGPLLLIGLGLGGVCWYLEKKANRDRYQLLQPDWAEGMVRGGLTAFAGHLLGSLLAGRRMFLRVGFGKAYMLCGLLYAAAAAFVMPQLISRKAD